VAALAAETKEDEYLAMVERHKDGQPGKRSIDLIAKLFAGLVEAMTKNDGDVLGDLFQSAISHQESGQFLTPSSISQLMSKLSIGDNEVRDDGSPVLVADPACGTGRMLIDAARQNPNVELFGQDVDARCTKICALNMGLRNLYGWVVCGNSLTCETRFAYRVAPFFHESPNGRRRGVIRDIPVEQTPALLISQETAADVQNLFVAQSLSDSDKTVPSSSDVSTIMEIPRWITRLEQHLEVGDSNDRPSPAEAADSEPESDREPKPADPPRQGNLF